MAERACREVEESVLRGALARAEDAVFIVDTEGIVVMWNLAAERILGYATRAAVGRPSCEIVVAEADGYHLCYRGCHGAIPVPMVNGLRNFDVHTRTKTGTPTWINVSALGVPSLNGRGCLTVHLLRDVTSARRLLSLVEEWRRVRGVVPETRPLTRREREILAMLSCGLSTRNLADRLHVSEMTVRNHVQSILEKLGVHSRLEAVAYATGHRLL
jgi:PAS domain S-box-containing protein